MASAGETVSMTEAEAVEHAITSRRAMRAFLPDPVDPALLRRILEVAAQAPSGTNMQPWKVRVLGPQSRARLGFADRALFLGSAAMHGCSTMQVC